MLLILLVLSIDNFRVIVEIIKEVNAGFHDAIRLFKVINRSIPLRERYQGYKVRERNPWSADWLIIIDRKYLDLQGVDISLHQFEVGSLDEITL